MGSQDGQSRPFCRSEKVSSRYGCAFSTAWIAETGRSGNLARPSGCEPKWDGVQPTTTRVSNATLTSRDHLGFIALPFDESNLCVRRVAGITSRMPNFSRSWDWSHDSFGSVNRFLRQAVAMSGTVACQGGLMEVIIASKRNKATSCSVRSGLLRLDNRIGTQCDRESWVQNHGAVNRIASLANRCRMRVPRGRMAETLGLVKSETSLGIVRKL